MKRIFLFALIAAFAFVAEAQTYKFYATDFKFKTIDKDGVWSEWSKWESTHYLVSISLDRNVVSIYSKVMQEFDIYEELNVKENENAETYAYKAVDQNGIRCKIFLAFMNDGLICLCIKYLDIIYAYNIVLRN